MSSNIINTVVTSLNFKSKKNQNKNKAITGNCFEKILSIDGMISLEEGRLLYDLAKAVKKNEDNCIVEIGSYRGRSTAALAFGSFDGNRIPIFAVDPHENFTGILGGKFSGQDRGIFFQNMLNTSCFEIVRLVNLSSEIITPGWQQKVSLLWIDGDHSYAGVKRDFTCWQPFLTEESIIAFDDSINPSIGPIKLIHELVEEKDFKIVSQVGKITVIQKK